MVLGMGLGGLTYQPVQQLAKITNFEYRFLYVVGVAVVVLSLLLCCCYCCCAGNGPWRTYISACSAACEDHELRIQVFSMLLV